MPARTAPTSSCRAPPTPRRTRTYVNTEGRVQLGLRAGFPPGEAREDWAILRALSEVLGKPLPYDTLGQRARAAGRRSTGASPRSTSSRAGGLGRLRQARARVDDAPFASPIANFYMTDPISRASRTMARMHRDLARQLMAAE